MQRREDNQVVADVCIYPQDQLQRDQLYQDQLQQDARQRRQLQLQLLQQQQEEQSQGDQGQRHQGQNQHEVSIYPDLNYSDLNYADLNYSRITASEVCLPSVFSGNKINFMLKKKHNENVKGNIQKISIASKVSFLLMFKNQLRLLLEVRAPSFLPVPQMLNVRFPLKCSI